MIRTNTRQISILYKDLEKQLNFGSDIDLVIDRSIKWVSHLRHRFSTRIWPLITNFSTNYTDYFTVKYYNFTQLILDKRYNVAV